MSTLKVGDMAPSLSGVDQNNNEVSLARFAGKKLVLYFYPKDDTPGCTTESCNLRDNYKALLAQGYQVLGVSPDTVAKHQKFIAKYDLPFDLLADTEKEVCNRYGVWVEKSMYGRTYMGVARTTFILDEEGRVEEIISKVNTKDHAAQIL